MDLPDDNSSANAGWNSSVYIVPPEKDGSFFSHCASITLKSDLSVSPGKGTDRLIVGSNEGT